MAIQFTDARNGGSGFREEKRIAISDITKLNLDKTKLIVISPFSFIYLDTILVVDKMESYYIMGMVLQLTKWDIDLFYLRYNFVNRLPERIKRKFHSFWYKIIHGCIPKINRFGG